MRIEKSVITIENRNNHLFVRKIVNKGSSDTSCENDTIRRNFNIACAGVSA
jgi:hypothetical protein